MLQDRASELARILDLQPMAGPAAILPLIIGDEAAALAQARSLFERQIFVPAIRYPSVARAKARLRFTITSAHTELDLETLRAALKDLWIASPS